MSAGSRNGPRIRSALSQVGPNSAKSAQRRSRRSSASPEPDAARRKAEAEGAGVAEAAVDAVIDVERVAAPQLHLHDDRPAARDQRAAGLGPQPHAVAGTRAGGRALIAAM